MKSEKGSFEAVWYRDDYITDVNIQSEDKTVHKKTNFLNSKRKLSNRSLALLFIPLSFPLH